MLKKTTQALAKSLTTSQLILLHEDSLNWSNPQLLSITEKELIKRDKKEALRSHWSAFLKKNELRTDSELAKAFLESADELSDILYFRILKRRIEEADPNSPYVCFADSQKTHYRDRTVANDLDSSDDFKPIRKSEEEKRLYRLDLTRLNYDKNLSIVS